MADDRQLLDSALNTMMMVSFTVPGGAPIGVASAVGLFFLDVLSPQARLSPAQKPVTQPQLQAAVNQLTADILDGIWKADVDKITSELLAFYTDFDDNWGFMKMMKVDGQRYVLDLTDNTTAGWEASIQKEFSDLDGPTSVLHNLRVFRNTLTLSSLNDPKLTPLQVGEHRTRTIGLYALVGSLAVAYLKAAVAWTWGNELLVAWQYQQYQNAVSYWRQQNAAYQAAHPFSNIANQYPGVNLAPNYSPPDWNKYLNDAGCPVPLLLREVQTMLDYCVTIPPTDDGQPAQPGLYTLMMNHWDAFEQKMTSYDVPLTPNAGISKQQMASAVEQGAVRAAEWERTRSQYAVGSVSEQDIAHFGKAIAAWRAAAASVSFTIYVVQPGDTLASIAKAKNHDATKIYDTNRDQLSDPTVLPVGTVLKIYQLDAIPYLHAGGV